MERYYDGDRLFGDVSRALQEALGKHGVELYSLLGVTTALEAIASPLKLHHLQGLVGREMGKLGQQAYDASNVARRVALLQSPHSVTVNPLMECIVVALKRAKVPLDTDALSLATYRIFLGKPRATMNSAEKQNRSLSPAFASALEYLTKGDIISRTDAGSWRLNHL
jgi:hypothetical protein